MVAFLEAPKLCRGLRSSPGSAQRWGPGAEEQVCTRARTTFSLAREEKADGAGAWEPGLE